MVVAVAFRAILRDLSTQVTIAERTITNNTPGKKKITVVVDGNWEDSVTYTTSSSIDLKFSDKVTIQGVFDTGMSFNFETTASESDSSTTRTASQSVKIEVPPNSKRTVRLVGITKVQEIDYSASIRVSGYFGANFPVRVQGRYYWFRSASSVLPKTEGTLGGTVTGTLTSDVHTIIDAAVAVTT